MNALKKVILLITIVFLVNCNDDDVTSQNQPPESFNLISPEDNTDREVLSPTFSWEAATDPEGGQVVYDLYVGKNADSEMLLTGNIIDTAYTPTEPLELFTTYYWKVVAKDENGMERTSNVQQFLVKPPLYLTEIDKDGEIQEFSYNQDGQITTIDTGPILHTVTVFYNPGGLISKLVGPLFGLYHYIYNEEGRLIEIFGDHETIKIEYNSLDQMLGAVIEYTDYDVMHIVRLGYQEGATHPSHFFWDEVRYLGSEEYDVLKSERTSFQWNSSGNLITLIREKNKYDGNGYMWNYTFTASYDNMQNPWYSVIKDKFGFDQFFVYTLLTFLETKFFNVGTHRLFWVSKNNIIQTTEIFQNTKTSQFSYNYTYNEEGYPTKAIIKKIDSKGLETTQEHHWNY